MKHLKIFENKINDSYLRNFSKEKDELYNKIKEFIIEEKLITETRNIISIFDVYLEHLEIDEGKFEDVIIVKVLFKNAYLYSYQYTEDSLIIDNIDSFYLFCDNPLAYKNSKKYNL